jgi:hypothetical protein
MASAAARAIHAANVAGSHRIRRGVAVVGRQHLLFRFAPHGRQSGGKGRS